MLLFHQGYIGRCNQNPTNRNGQKLVTGRKIDLRVQMGYERGEKDAGTFMWLIWRMKTVLGIILYLICVV